MPKKLSRPPFDSDAYRQKLIDDFDADTLDAGLDKRDAAELALDLAAEFKLRAEGLNDEADNDDEDRDGE